MLVVYNKRIYYINGKDMNYSNFEAKRKKIFKQKSIKTYTV